ncbi:hypothetical protein HYU07_01740 [Candidatus Woesearchaeota archaeon]|nr:hypothetical protein [Candidatus Woesearchaeota archaeon]
MTDTSQTENKYQVFVERVGKVCIPKDDSEKWGYDAFLEFNWDYKLEKVYFISIAASTVDDHLLLQEAHLKNLSNHRYRGCLADNIPFDIISIPKNDPLRAIIPADKKMRNKLEELVCWIMQEWYDATPEDIAIAEIIEK